MVRIESLLYQLVDYGLLGACIRSHLSLISLELYAHRLNLSECLVVEEAG